MYKLNNKWNTEAYKWRRFASENYNREWILTHNLKGSEYLDTSELGLSSEKIKDSSAFQVVWLKNIDRLIDMLPLNFNPKEYTLVDVGCGSGISTLYFSKFYLFNDFIGFDLSSKLIKIARSNLLSFQSSKSSLIKFLESDAKDFKLPEKPCFIFMYNPFGFTTAKKFIKNNILSLKRNGAYIAISYDAWIEKLLEMNIHKNHYRDEVNNLSIINI